MVHQEITEDPDIAQAVEDFRAQVVEMRKLSAEAIKPGGVERYKESARNRCAEIMSGLGIRAQRIGLTADELLVFVNADLNHRARRGRGAPTRPTIRTLMDAVTDRTAEEATAHLELNAAQKKMRLATAARVAAEGAYAKYAAGGRS